MTSSVVVLQVAPHGDAVFPDVGMYWRYVSYQRLYTNASHISMAISVVVFSREGYKIRKVFA